MHRLADRLTQRGAALTEFVVVGTLLIIPLFLLIPVLAKLISQSHDVQMGARYAAWERTVWYDSERPPPHGNESAARSVAKSDADVAREIDARIFAAVDEPIISADVDFRIDTFSRDEAHEVLLREYDDSRYAAQESEEHQPKGFVGDMSQAMEGLKAVTRFDLNTDGLFESRVAVAMIDLSRWFDVDGVDMSALTLRAKNVIFAEAWEAGGTEHAKYVIGGLTPQQWMDNSAVKTAQQATASLPIGEELHEDCLVFGYASIESVPDHRTSRPDRRLTAVRGTGEESDCDLRHPTEDDDE